MCDAPLRILIGIPSDSVDLFSFKEFLTSSVVLYFCQVVIMIEYEVGFDLHLYLNANIIQFSQYRFSISFISPGLTFYFDFNISCTFSSVAIILLFVKIGLGVYQNDSVSIIPFSTAVFK